MDDSVTPPRRNYSPADKAEYREQHKCYKADGITETQHKRGLCKHCKYCVLCPPPPWCIKYGQKHDLKEDHWDRQGKWIKKRKQTPGELFQSPVRSLRPRLLNRGTVTPIDTSLLIIDEELQLHDAEAVAIFFSRKKK